ncbi:putative conserved secreted protein [Synechococcus sp. RS9915]|nr:putative conserved secreted protein [Synechococcus sp. RS9915]
MRGISLKPTLQLQGLNLVSRLDRRVMVAMVGFLSALSSLPGADVGLFQQLNQELGALCQAPPAKAVKVCALHARLVNR